jgi:hypothetical protein
VRAGTRPAPQKKLGRDPAYGPQKRGLGRDPSDRLRDAGDELTGHAPRFPGAPCTDSTSPESATTLCHDHRRLQRSRPRRDDRPSTPSRAGEAPSWRSENTNHGSEWGLTIYPTRRTSSPEAWCVRPRGRILVSATRPPSSRPSLDDSPRVAPRVRSDAARARGERIEATGRRECNEEVAAVVVFELGPESG